MLTIGHINSQILSDEEKIIRDIRKKFTKTVLLGDIVLDDKQEKILNRYMREQLEEFVKSPSTFIPDYKRVFAVGLVRYAMKYYNKNHKGDFWPYFQQEYGVKLTTNCQQRIHRLFYEIMNSYGKFYQLSAPNLIDNITMHSFVADNCAEQLFEYLLAFWRIDLVRGSEDFTDTDDKYKFLISAIANSSDKQKVMSHTSLLINDKKTRVELIRKIKRIIKLINVKFWEDTEIADTGNRNSSVLENCETIVLNSNKYNLTDVDLKAFGKKLKEFRERSGFYRAEAARYIGIAERTLKAYEDGEREIGINALYKLIRLYGVGDISNFFY